LVISSRARVPVHRTHFSTSDVSTRILIRSWEITSTTGDPEIDSVVSMSQKDDHLPLLNSSGDLLCLFAGAVDSLRWPLPPVSNYTRDGRSYVRTSIGSIGMYFTRCRHHRPASPRTTAVLFGGSDWCCSVFDWSTSPRLRVSVFGIARARQQRSAPAALC
jgi:hypothetical protein